MKKKMMAASALGLVLALLVTSTSMVIGNEEMGPETVTDGYEELDFDGYLELDGSVDEEIDDVPANTSSTAPRFGPLVKRAYGFLTRDFVGSHSEWEKLPGVKTIFTANSSGEWMYNALPRINATGEARIVDEDGDGYPELVIWKHYSRGSNATVQDLNLTREEIAEHLEAVNLSGIMISWMKGFTLVYIDRDGDGNPEMIQLTVVHFFKVGRSTDAAPRIERSFRWTGRARDRDSDGDWEVQEFHTGTHLMVNLRLDRNPELVKYHNADYIRTDHGGRPMWDRISARASSGKVIDRNSDGYPESKERRSVSGIYRDGDGNGWPEIIRISIGKTVSRDADSDGNPELGNTTRASLIFLDRNDDMDPELVRISFNDTTRIDRNSDGRVDLIKIHRKQFVWIDRNSDGIPERVVRKEVWEERRPGSDIPEDEGKPERNGETEVERPDVNEGGTEQDREQKPDPVDENREMERQLKSRA
ncbi:MAG: hypothetical protein ACMUHM_04530 [Thermoplasmatota archaeon]